MCTFNMLIVHTGSEHCGQHEEQAWFVKGFPPSASFQRYFSNISNIPSENSILRLTFLVSLLSLFYTVERVCDKDKLALEYLEIDNYLNLWTLKMKKGRSRLKLETPWTVNWARNWRYHHLKNRIGITKFHRGSKKQRKTPKVTKTQREMGPKTRAKKKLSKTKSGSYIFLVLWT